MSEIVYLNDKFLPLGKARISVLDRGFLFGDGVYEVIAVANGKPLYLREHLKRLRVSLRAIYMTLGLSNEKIKCQVLKLLHLNHAQCGTYLLYLQVTRGVDKTRNRFLPRQLKPTIFMLLKATKPVTDDELHRGKTAVTAPDIRWHYGNIKSISLLPSLLLADQAKRVGCDETLIIRDGNVLEGTSSNVFVVKNGRIFTPRLSEHNLSGVTREKILQAAHRHKILITEKDISEKFLRHADEIWISSSTRGIYPIVKLDGKKVGTGKAGEVWGLVSRIMYRR